MKKLWIAPLLTAGLLLTAAFLNIAPVPTAYADGTVEVSLPGHAVTLNGQTVSSEYSRYPFLVYKDITYFPMTYYDCKLLGLNKTWTKEDGLTLEKNDAGLSEYIREVRTAKNEETQRAQIAEGPVAVNGKLIDNSTEPYPVLSFRDVAYFPLTWQFAVEEFGWDYEFDDATGLTISNPKAVFASEEAWDGAVDSYGGLMGTGDMKLASMLDIFHSVDADGNEAVSSSLRLYNVTGKDIRLLEDDFQWEYRVYRVIGKQDELVYRKAVTMYTGAIPKSHWMHMEIPNSYWSGEVPSGDYRCVLVHPKEYRYQIPGEEQIRTEPTEGNGYAVTFSSMITLP